MHPYASKKKARERILLAAQYSQQMERLDRLLRMALRLGDGTLQRLLRLNRKCVNIHGLSCLVLFSFACIDLFSKRFANRLPNDFLSENATKLSFLTAFGLTKGD